MQQPTNAENNQCQCISCQHKQAETNLDIIARRNARMTAVKG